MKFKKGDVLTTSSSQERPLARVKKVTRDGTVHCVNLLACMTMPEGHEFQFVPNERTRYYVLVGVAIVAGIVYQGREFRGSGRQSAS